MKNPTWQANTLTLDKLSLVELHRLWVRDKNALQMLCNQITDSISSQQNNCKISINGPKGSGKSHLLHLLIKHLADVFISQDQQIPAPLKMVFIDQNGAQINDYIDLLSTIVEQSGDRLNQLQSNTQNELEQAIIAQLELTPLMVFIEQFEHIAKALDPAAKTSLQKLVAQNALSLIVTESQPSDVLPFTNVDLPALESQQTLHLIELLLANTTEPQTQNQQAANPREIPLLPPTSTTPELKLCNTMLYPLFAGNAHYYQHFIDTIGIPQLNNLSQQLSHFIAQQTMLNNAKLAKLAPQQRQIVSLLSKQVLHQLGSLPVTHIASQLRLTHQTTSSQLKKLRDHHWVASTKVGRGSFYQLADITQSYSLAYNHLHPLHGESNGVNISIDFAQQWLKSSAIDLPSDDQQNFIVDNFTSKNSTVNASSINTTVLSEHFVAPMLPLIIRLKHHIDSYLTTLNQQQPEAEELFTSLLQKLTALSDNITNSPFAEQQQISALSHIELLNGLIARALIGSLGVKQPTHHAIALSDHLFEFVSHLNLDEPWKLLGQLWVNTSAIMAHSTDIPKLGNYISKLEQHESQLRSLDNSINIAHCLVYKSWGFAQQGDKQKLQQTLEQLRIRSDKRNSPQLTGAYCHAIKLSINYIAEQDLKLAQRLVKQMLELSHRYPIDDLYFACLWRTSVFEQQQNSFDTLLKLITKVHQSNIFNGELCLWLAHIHQNQQLEAIRNALSASQNLSVFSAALIKTACHSLISEPQSFIHRYNQWQQILTTDKEQDIKTEGIKEQRKVLQHTQKILTVLHQYHQQPQEQQLLQLPPLEQKLITQKLITQKLIKQKLINKDLAINT